MDFSILKTKTFITSLFTVGVGVAQAFGMAVPEGAVVGLVGLTAIFMRMGISKV